MARSGLDKGKSCRGSDVFRKSPSRPSVLGRTRTRRRRTASSREAQQLVRPLAVEERDEHARNAAVVQPVDECAQSRRGGHGRAQAHAHRAVVVGSFDEAQVPDGVFRQLIGGQRRPQSVGEIRRTWRPTHRPGRRTVSSASSPARGRCTAVPGRAATLFPCDEAFLERKQKRRGAHTSRQDQHVGCCPIYCAAVKFPCWPPRRPIHRRQAMINLQRDVGRWNARADAQPTPPVSDVLAVAVLVLLAGAAGTGRVARHLAQVEGSPGSRATATRRVCTGARRSATPRASGRVAAAKAASAMASSSSPVKGSM